MVVYRRRSTIVQNWEKNGAPVLAERILRMIDNTPAWEIAQSVARPKGGAAKPLPRASRTRFVARGALETFGPGRPRE